MQTFFRKSTHHIIRAYALLFSFLSHFTTKRSTVKSTYSTHVPLIKKQIKILLKDGLTRWSDISSYSMLIFIFSFTIELDIICMGSFVTTFQTAFHLILKLFCLKLIFLMFLDRFDVLMSKINFKKKKHYFDAFLSKKHFEKKLLPHPQTPPITICTTSILSTLIYILSQNI
jgi:hypothetical protein